jgi:hypothetical protein
MVQLSAGRFAPDLLMSSEPSTMEVPSAPAPYPNCLVAGSRGGLPLRVICKCGGRRAGHVWPAPRGVMPIHLHSPTGHRRRLSPSNPLVTMHGHAWLTEVVSNVSAGAVRRLGRQAGGGGRQRERLLAQLWRRSVARGPGDCAAACLQVCACCWLRLMSQQISSRSTGCADVIQGVCASQAVHRKSRGCGLAASDLQKVRCLVSSSAGTSRQLQFGSSHKAVQLRGAG